MIDKTARSLPLTGVFTDLITPFREDRIDEPAFIALVERQIAAGVRGLVVASGAAGEAPTLCPEEASRLIDLCVKTAAGRAVVVAGAASNSTTATIALVRQAQDLGADGALVVAPWYCRPSQEGAFRHYEAIVEAVGFPMLIGDCPSRTSLTFSVATLERMATLPSLVGIVDATGDAARISMLRRSCPDWVMLSGLDPSMLGCLANGGHGCVSLTSNLAPEAVCASYAACAAQDWPAARRMQDRLSDLHDLVALDPVPSTVKLAMSLRGLCRPDVRLPITPCGQPTSARLGRAMRDLGDAR
jgi:4-hydroxy-tetrahydrodipicolinate synthase